MKKKLLFSLVAMTASVFADGDVNTSTAFAEENLVADNNCNPKPKECKPKPPECKPKPPECKPKPKPKPCEPCIRPTTCPVVLTSARPCSNVGIYLFGDALYWHADIGNSDWAFVNHNSAASVASGPNKDVDFGWDWGFRAGIGFNMDHDYWDTNFYYTWFRTTSDHEHVNVSAPALAVDLTGEAGVFTTGSNHAKVNFNVVDWELGRSFYVSRSLSLRPHVGVKGAWIKNKSSENFTAGLATVVGTTAYHISNNTKFWGVGPSAGFNTSWWFGYVDALNTNENPNKATSGLQNKGYAGSRSHFSIFGDFAGALMFGHFSTKHRETATTTSILPGAGGFHPTHLNRNLVVPVLSTVMGLGWDICFNCDKMHFGIKLGYEFQWWFRQSQRLIVNGGPGSSLATPRYFRIAEDLALQGGTLELRFDF